MIGKLQINSDKSVIIETESELIKYQLASFDARLGARLIDGLIITIPMLFMPIIPAWLYWSLLQSGKSQSTIGQNAFRIKTLSLDGSKISFGQASGRFFGNFLNILTIFIGYIMFFFNDKNQCLHDNLSGCIVVKEIERKFKTDITE